MPFPRLENPPQTIQVHGVRPGPMPVTLETTTGEVLDSPQFPAYRGTIFGSASELLPAQEALAVEEQRADFRSAQEAWEQFSVLNQGLAESRDGSGAPGEGSFAARLTEPDASGVRFENIRNYYGRKTPLTTLEQALKYIIRKEKLKRWEDFPLWLLHEAASGELDFLLTPAPLELADPYAPSSEEVDDLTARAEEKFRWLWLLRNVLEYHRPALGEKYPPLLEAWQHLAAEDFNSALAEDFAEAIQQAAQGANVQVFETVDDVPF